MKLYQVQRPIPDDSYPDGKIPSGTVLDVSDWPNINVLIEQGYLAPADTNDIPPSEAAQRIAALEAAAAAAAEEKAALEERIAALEAQAGKASKSNKKPD